MKFVVLSAALTFLLSTGSAAHAFEFRAPVTQQLFACESKNLTRTAHRTDLGADEVAVLAQLGACCQTQLRCAQFLATRSVHKPRLDPRT